MDGSEHFEFHLDEPQAQAIVDMRLGRLSGLEQEKINDEYKDLESRIAGFEEILSCDANILAVVKQELQEIKQKYGDERHTRIENVPTRSTLRILSSSRTAPIPSPTSLYQAPADLGLPCAAPRRPRYLRDEHPRGGLREGHLYGLHA